MGGKQHSLLGMLGESRAGFLDYGNPSSISSIGKGASFSPIEDHANFRNYKKDTVYISFLWGKMKACSSSSFMPAQKKNWGTIKTKKFSRRN